jgi:hypothetical protein
MGPHEPRMGEATAELPVGEHLEEREPASSRGSVSRPVLGEDGRLVGCRASEHCLRAPQVLLWLTDRRSQRRRIAMLFVGVDWGERHHDLCLLDQDGTMLAARRIADGLAGVGGAACAGGRPCAGPGAGGGRDRDRLRAGWSGRCWLPATRCMRLTRSWWAATAAAIGSHGPSLTAATPRCWPTWSAPTATTTARSPATARWPRRSRCWPVPTRI